MEPRARICHDRSPDDNCSWIRMDAQEWPPFLCKSVHRTSKSQRRRWPRPWGVALWPWVGVVRVLSGAGYRFDRLAAACRVDIPARDARGRVAVAALGTLLEVIERIVAPSEELVLLARDECPLWVTDSLFPPIAEKSVSSWRVCYVLQSDIRHAEKLTLANLAI